MDIKTKRCTKCGETKAITEFYVMKGMRDGFRNDCKVCNLAAKKARYDADPQKAIESVLRSRRKNPEYYAAYNRKRRERPEVKRHDRDSHLRRKFGITSDRYDEMLVAQGGGCAICGRAPRPDISLHVDHEHGTGKVRGLLCFPCNQSLGLLADDPERCRAAAAYLDAFDEEVHSSNELIRARLRALIES